MDLGIFWTDFSKNQLRSIFIYHKENASLTIARKLVIGLTKATIKLKKQPMIGQIEESLQNPIKEFRYIVFKNYKIIYWINSERNAIEVLDVFDTRQSPLKIIRTKQPD